MCGEDIPNEYGYKIQTAAEFAPRLITGSLIISSTYYYYLFVCLSVVVVVVLYLLIVVFAAKLLLLRTCCCIDLRRLYTKRGEHEQTLLLLLLYVVGIYDISEACPHNNTVSKYIDTCCCRYEVYYDAKFYICIIICMHASYIYIITRSV